MDTSATLSTRPGDLAPDFATHTIATKGLTKVYPGGTLAVDGLDLEVRRGEFFGLLGPNGAGKTTTVGMLTTRVVPTGGEMWVGGYNVRTQPVVVKRIIGVVTQFNTLDRRLTAWENLYYHGRYFGLSRAESRREADRVLELVQLEEKRKAMVDSLSGGMQQRLLIGRALAHSPEVLFLDEPTTGIDPQGRIALWAVLSRLHGEGLTILLTTHYMEEAEQLCERLAIMDHGKILASGSPSELKELVKASTVITIQATAPSDEFLGDLRGMPGVGSVEVRGDEIELRAQTSRGMLPAIANAAMAREVDLTDVNVQPPSLETVFITLTGRKLRE
jgi:ABC-2 type transport system ATP-binding protein